MGDEVRLTAEERGWFDSWRDRCDEDPALQRHEGYIEMAADILRYRVQAARVEDAARLAEVERLARRWLAWSPSAPSDQPRAEQVHGCALDLLAALGVTAPTASEAGVVETGDMFERWGVALPAPDGFINPSQVEYASGREGAEHKADVLNSVRPTSLPEHYVPVHCWTTEWYPAPAEASEVEGSDRD